jgi:hexokinase
MGSSLDRFLRRKRMHPAAVDLARVTDAFLDEMSRGLAGQTSSLPMIPTYIETSRAVPVGEKVIALDAGGTNMRVAVVSFDAHGKPLVEDLTRHRMPGSDAAVDKREFFHAMAEVVLPVARKAARIGFCFSYPAVITPEKDGKLIEFTKEIKATGVEGELVGKNLAEALAEAGAPRPSRIVLLNDTVATLLAGRNALPGRRFDDFMGLVCGTGFNAAYVERNDRILKASGLDAASSQIVNTESGSFGRGVRGEIDDLYDAAMINPGKYRHEKTISGAYLGPLCLFTVQCAAREGCFSPETARAIAGRHGLTTPEMNDFLLSPDSPDNPLGALCAGIPTDDARGLYVVCESVLERAAAMVAVNLGGVLLKTDKGRDPRYPVCIAVDGTTFWQLRTFRIRVESYMRSLLTGRRARAWEITSVEDAPLLGAAIAALTN